MIRVAEFFGVEPESLIISDTDEGGGPAMFGVSVVFAVGLLISQLFMTAQEPLTVRPASA